MEPDQLSARFRDLQRYVGWSDEDAARVQALHRLAQVHFADLIEDFYAEIERHPAAARVITGGAEQVARLKNTLVVWLEQLFSGPYDEHYLARRWAVGLRHAQIGLNQIYTNAALSRLRSQLIDYVAADWTGNTSGLTASLGSLMRRIDLDLAIIEDAYQSESRSRQQQVVTDLGYQAVDGLSTAALLETVAQTVSATLQVEFCQIWELIPASHRIVLRAGNPGPGEELGVTSREVDRDSRLFAFLGAGEPNVSHAEAALRSTSRSAANGAALVEIVIPGNKAPFGLMILRTERYDMLSKSDRNFLDSIANIVAAAVDRRRADERLLQSERLAAIGQVVAGLAHESRNALQRSLACLDMLALEVEDNPSALDLVERTQRAQTHLHHLYEEVRGYAAPIRLDCRKTSLPELWREAWTLLAAQHGGRRAELVERLHDHDLRIVADHFRLVQVFRNMLENSLAAASDPVQIEIEVSLTHLHGRPALAISVHDNGPGLKGEQQQRVFEPFFTTKTQGTGLGMAIALRIIEAHGGLLRVGEGRHPGAEFVIVLPREQK